MNAKIKDVRSEIRERKDRLVKEVEDFESNLGSTSEANRLKHSRGEKLFNSVITL
jgi:thiamine biosynthesis lipoprotein ApbE